MQNQEVAQARSQLLQLLNNQPVSSSFLELASLAEDGLKKPLEEAKKVVEAAARASGGAAKLDNSAGEELPPLADAEFVRYGLKAALDMVFRETDKIDIGITGNRANKIAGKMYKAAETLLIAETAIASVEDALREACPGAPAGVYRPAAKAFIALTDWDAAKEPDRELASTIVRSLQDSGYVSLGFFICPPVEFGYLSSTAPEQYLRTSMTDSLLSRQVERLAPLFVSLRAAGIPFKLTAVIGDKDEDDYIWPVLGRPPGLDELQLEPRRETLLNAVEDYLRTSIKTAKKPSTQLLGSENLQVLRLSTFPESLRAQEAARWDGDEPSAARGCISSDDVGTEVERMEELWRPGDYYDGIPAPSREKLREIVALKFAAYAAQGVQLRELDPDLVMIQTERPPGLRTDMLNDGLIRLAQQRIPFVYALEPEIRFKEVSDEVGPKLRRVI